MQESIVMTASLRRKPRTIAKRTKLAKMAAGLLGLDLLLVGGQALAQDVPPAQEPMQTLHFTKPANTLGQAPPIQPKAAAPLPALQLPALAPAPIIKQKPLVEQPAPIVPSLAPPPPPILAEPAKTVTPPPVAPPTRLADEPLQRVFFQPPVAPGMGGPGPSARAPGEESLDYQQIQLEPPGPQRIFRLESEAALQERIRQEAKERPIPERVMFPEEPIVGRGPYVARAFPTRDMLAEPYYVCYKRLYFEDLNTERYGWDLGFIQPFVSAGKFYADLAILPYKFWTNPLRCYECNSGYCLPGDPVPYLLYPPQLSMTGTIAEAATIVGLLAIFP
jgi:hypothetical protein